MYKIITKKDLRDCLQQDGRKYARDLSLFSRLIEFIAPSEGTIIWNQIKNLRLYEYRKNNRKGIVNKILFLFQRIKYRRIENRTFMFIPPNVFGPGLYIPHIGRIAVPETAQVGCNCTIRPGTLFASNLGVKNNRNVKHIVVGDNVEFSDGSKIFCSKIGNNVIVGPNAVVLRNLPDDVTVYGNPARVIPKDL